MQNGAALAEPSYFFAVVNSFATVVSQGYHGYGKYRLGSVLPTDHRFTGQKLDATGLMYYGARYYDRREPSGRDTLVTDPINVWDYNRFTESAQFPRPG